MATLTSKGQITVPKAVREALELGRGDRVVFLVADDCSVTLRKASGSLAKLKGLVESPDKPVSLDQMDAAIRKRR